MTKYPSLRKIRKLGEVIFRNAEILPATDPRIPTSFVLPASILTSLDCFLPSLNPHKVTVPHVPGSPQTGPRLWGGCPDSGKWESTKANRGISSCFCRNLNPHKASHCHPERAQRIEGSAVASCAPSIRTKPGRPIPGVPTDRSPRTGRVSGHDFSRAA